MEKQDTIYQFQASDIKGNLKNFSDYAGKVLLIVNTASRCGYTPQYEGLEELYKKYKDQNFLVLGFPCNQFGAQEPGTDSEVESFCQLNYGVSFPMFAKVRVRGGDTHPLFQFLCAQAPGILGTKSIKWNFTKFLVDRNGVAVARFASKDAPFDIAPHIEKLL